MNQRIFSIIIFIVLAVALLAQSSGKPEERNAIIRESEDGTPVAALFAAASDGSIDTMDAALRCGATVDSRNRFGWTPLMISVFYQQEGATRWLIRHHADVNSDTATGMTPLLIAARGGDQTIVDDLINAHADLCAADSVGRNVLIVAAECEGGAAVMRDLLARGLPPDWADHDGQTPLMEAVACGNIRIASILLARGANFHAKDHAGHTALEQSRMAHDDPMAAFLSRHESTQ
jgi:ankyrin repeat protein